MYRANSFANAQIQLMGFKFAIDVFGAGFSDFHDIKMLPMDYAPTSEEE